MEIIEKSKYVLINSKGSSTFSNFVGAFEKAHQELKNSHIIIQLSDKLNIADKDFFVLLEYVDFHQQKGTTFVVVCSGIDVDNLPETFNIVPTLQEAEDVLEMENIQRDLGF